MRVGSVGLTRARGLARLRTTPHVRIRFPGAVKVCGQYASSANQATKAQQIAVAERVLAGQGIGAWPTCGAGG